MLVSVCLHATPGFRRTAKTLISEELWWRTQAVRASRRATVKTVKKTARVNLLQSLVLCVQCGRHLGIQKPKRRPTLYREDPHQRGYHDCSYIELVRAEIIGNQVADLIHSIPLLED